VPVDAKKVIAVPSAFSPNGDGMNDVLYVRGFRIASFHMRVFDRWGKEVFDTEDKEKGWDGRQNGNELPADTYGYVIDVAYTDGTREQKSGSITLLR
jgi:gliding motility-associated-like protein